MKKLILLDKLGHIDVLFMLKTISGQEANEVCLSSIPKGKDAKCYLFFNRDSYKTYCKKYHEYREWVKNRNEERYKNTISHGKNYDSKNLMHTFRLLEMAKEIGDTKKVVVRRPDREFLLGIKSGKYEYDDLIKMAYEKIEEINEVYAKSDLPDEPDRMEIQKLSVKIRTRFYDR